jgi:hypothetical protein
MKPFGPICVVLTALVVAGVAGAGGPATELTFDVASVRTSAVRSFVRVDLAGARCLGEVGEPDLPAEVLSFVIPSDARVEDVAVSFSDERELPGTYLVIPVQPEAPIGQVQPWADPDPAIYAGDALFPPIRVEYLGDGYLGGYRIASVAVYPLQYAPATGRLILATGVSVELELAPGADRSRPRHRVTASSDRLYRALVEKMVENPEDVAGSRSAPADVVDEVGRSGFSPRYTPSLDGSPVEYVVITSEEFEPYFSDLVDWKTKKGVPAAVRTVSWIESNYPGGCDTQQRIRMFIADAYSSWGTTYVLLGGDTEVVPVRLAKTTYYDGEELPSDLYYSDLDGDWNDDGDHIFGEAYKGEADPGDSVDLYPDVFVGRAPAADIVELDTFIEKGVAYERTPVPLLTERNLYLAEVLFPYDWQGGEYSMDGGFHVIEPSLPFIPPGTGATKLYSNHAEFPEAYPLTTAAALDSIDLGYNVVVHVGHGNKDVMRVGHGNYMTMSDMSGLSNGIDRSSFMWFLNCTSAAIDYDCIAERAMNNRAGGAFALFGPSRFAFPATTRDYYWDWCELVYEDGVTECGVACATAKALHSSQEESGPDNTDRWTVLSFLLLGDPELSLWVGRPGTLAVSHPASIEVGDGEVTVSVTDGSPVGGALVCIRKDADCYATGLTDPGGVATLGFAPDLTGEASVTVTRDGYLPAESTLAVDPTAGPHVFLGSWEVDDDDAGGSDGNDNGRAEAGEVIEIGISVRNGGSAGVGGLTAALSSDDALVDVEDGTASIGSVAPGGVVTVGSAFRVALSSDCPNEHDVAFDVEFSDRGRSVWSDEAVLRVYRPDLRQLYIDVDDSAGNANGAPEPGESVVLSVEVANDGNGDAEGVAGVLRYPGAEATVTDSTDTWGSIAAGATQVGSGGFAFEVGAPLDGPFRFELSDGRGNAWSRWLDMSRPAAPESLSGKVRGTTIELSWSPSGEGDLLGYDVYRAGAEEGPYSRVNGAPVESAALYSDAGLDENTAYFYYVTAVDSSGNESDASSVLPLSTNPPSQEGWPLPTQGGMYGSPAIADIDSDGDLEVIVLSDEVYAWHHDGAEVLDGDGDPRTNGLFAMEGAGGYQCSPAVGEVDGDPGVEIVASAWANIGSSTDRAYETFVWNAEDGTVVPGWPVTTRSFCWASPTIADLDRDGRGEVLLPSADGRLYCWRYNGSEYIDGDDDPQTNGVFAELGASWCYGSPAVADLDGDGGLEVIQASTNDSVYAWGSDGTRVPGWPVYVMERSHASVAVGDVDLDGEIEVVVSSEANRVWLLERDGSVVDGWPVGIVLDGDLPPSPVLADMTGDGYLEVVLVGSNGNIKVVDREGESLPGWPASLGANTRSTPAVADLDGDSAMDVVVGSHAGRVYAFGNNGDLLEGWPIQTEAEVYSSPSVADLDADGDNEVVVTSMDTRVYVWDSEGVFDGGRGVEWGHFLHDAWRSQCHAFVPPTGVEQAGGSTLAWAVLEQNRPNPFNPLTRIAFSVPESPGDGGAAVSLTVYSVDGRVVRRLLDTELPPGRHSSVWDGRDGSGREVASGVYFYRLTVGPKSLTRRMVLLK